MRRRAPLRAIMRPAHPPAPPRALQGQPAALRPVELQARLQTLPDRRRRLSQVPAQLPALREWRAAARLPLQALPPRLRAERAVGMRTPPPAPRAGPEGLAEMGRQAGHAALTVPGGLEEPAAPGAPPMHLPPLLAQVSSRHRIQEAPVPRHIPPQSLLRARVRQERRQEVRRQAKRHRLQCLLLQLPRALLSRQALVQGQRCQPHGRRASHSRQVTPARPLPVPPRA